MSDIAEVRRGKRFIYENANIGRKAANAFFAIKHQYPDLWKEMQEEFSALYEWDVDNTFISCWSECDLLERTHDDLTMWRGYGGDGNGVAIVVDSDFLSHEEDYLGEILTCPVSYETPEQFEVRAAGFFRSFSVNVLSLGGDIINQYKDIIVGAFGFLCFYLAVTHKDPGFRAEKEWRFVWRRKPAGLDDPFENLVKTKSFPTVMRERFCLPLSGDHPDWPTRYELLGQIRSVMVGPSSDMEHSHRALRNLLLKNRFDLEAIVTAESSIPYRSGRR